MAEAPWITIILALIAAAGGILGAVNALTQSRVSHKLGVRQHDIEAEENAVTGYQALTAAHVAEIGRLAADRDTILVRLDKVEAEIAVERGLKRVALEHIRALYSWIAVHMPGASPPDVPDELADHITTSRKDPS